MRPIIFKKPMGHWMHFQNINSDAAIQSVGNTTKICFQAGWDITLSRKETGRRSSLGPQVSILISRGNGGGRSGEMALSSGIRENVEEKERLRAVKGCGWWEHLFRGEKTSSVLDRAKRLYSGAQAGMVAGD